MSFPVPKRRDTLRACEYKIPFAAEEQTLHNNKIC